MYDYPRSIKSFYMRDNDDKKTVAAFDLFAPGVGELVVGGSQREESYEKLVAKMTEFGLDPEDYWWYLDLRKYGSVPHAGHGLGFDRLVCYVAAIETSGTRSPSRGTRGRRSSRRVSGTADLWSRRRWGDRKPVLLLESARSTTPNARTNHRSCRMKELAPLAPPHWPTTRRDAC